MQTIVRAQRAARESRMRLKAPPSILCSSLRQCYDGRRTVPRGSCARLLTVTRLLDARAHESDRFRRSRVSANRTVALAAVRPPVARARVAAVPADLRRVTFRLGNEPLTMPTTLVPAAPCGGSSDALMSPNCWRLSLEVTGKRRRQRRDRRMPLPSLSQTEDRGVVGKELGD